MRKEAAPFRRSSVIRVVTEAGAAQAPCHSTIGLTPNRWLSSTHSSPKWQNSTMVSRLASPPHKSLRFSGSRAVPADRQGPAPPADTPPAPRPSPSQGRASTLPGHKSEALWSMCPEANPIGAFPCQYPYPYDSAEIPEAIPRFSQIGSFFGALEPPYPAPAPAEIHKKLRSPIGPAGRTAFRLPPAGLCQCIMLIIRVAMPNNQ